ncbi:non-structural maintenance of chromosomes element 4 family protein [Aspergillus melleus]|uniref:non-structural maintenance of chromosomes element 4 family protein n=1 Tax=Aspergillus melleus TaxID=138277 RepID=UPI001E8E1934|nr:uncharacterized protein LDX57_001237 [Aspergillus melleus]KAH8423477.1 hypothetical protein LDX57_001237 [Aspergillus melleus]
MARNPRAAGPSQHSSPGTYSDKENNQHQNSSQNRKRTQDRAMASSSASAKRQRLANRIANNQHGSQSQISRSQQDPDKQYYDPDQDEKERRRIRKGLRDLTRELHDSRTEYMQAGNDGIRQTIKKANEFFRDVKQTSDATIDSRLLVSAADLSYKKTAQLVLGDASAGVDVDEFVSKCISFMRHGPEDPQTIPSSTQRRRAHGRSQADPNDSDEDQGDALNWDWLGRSACVRSNSRPAVSGFLLGPLSVQKRTRHLTQRRAREQIDPSQAVRPQELEDKDLDRQETSNLTTICSNINKLLAETQKAGQNSVEGVLEKLFQQSGDEPTDEMVQKVMALHNVADDGGIPLFNFCINPKSFGQSVENLFYVSFLVRDGTAGISVDSRQLPTLHHSKPYAPSEAQKKGVQKHQAIFSLDFETWQDLIDAYSIKESIIPHRREEESQATGQGWYS